MNMSIDSAPYGDGDKTLTYDDYDDDDDYEFDDFEVEEYNMEYHERKARSRKWEKEE